MRKKADVKKPDHCYCWVCRSSKVVDAIRRKLSKQERKFFNDILCRVMHAEDDGAYWRSIVDGSWPSADEMLKKFRERAGNKMPT